MSGNSAASSCIARSNIPSEPETNDAMQNPGSLKPYLIFRLGEELFAADVNNVLEILEIPKITKVPRSPEYMRGVINLRGSVLPVVDARIKFGLPPTEDTVDTCIIVMRVEIEGRVLTVGAVTDGVLEVLEIGSEQVQAAPTVGSAYRTGPVQGMIDHGGVFIIMLDVARVFNGEETEQMAVTGAQAA
jgi:purine-binding chemotaxis protein CheW